MTPFFTHAITRTPADTVRFGLTCTDLGDPDLTLTRRQFRSYVDALLELGLVVVTLPAEAAFPDGHFVHDTAVVTPELAFLTRPGAHARRGELHSVAPVVSRFKPTYRMGPEGCLDASDVLLVNSHFYVGLSSRTNQAGASQFAAVVQSYGYRVSTLQVERGLHLKASVSHLGRNVLLLTEAYANHPLFRGYAQVVLSLDEEYAANTLWVNDSLVTPSGYPATAEKLRGLRMPVIEIDVSEFRKMGGGVGCLSVLF